MKKLIALSILVSLFVFAAFAEGESPISISGSAEAALVPLQIVHGGPELPDGKGGTYTDTYVGAGLGRPWDPQGPMVQLKAEGKFFEEILGAKVDLQFYYNTTANAPQFAIGDFAELWFKPADWFKLDVGRFNEDILRGKVGDDDWSLWTVGMKGKDTIFNRFKGTAGALMGFTPVEGLYIGILVPRFAQFNTDADPFLTGAGTNISLLTPARPGTGNPGDPDYVPPTPATYGDPWRAAQIYKGIQAGIGYEIQGVGLVRAQYVGSRNEKDPDEVIKDLFNVNYTPARLEAAFAFTGVEGLVLDLGLKFWFPTSSFVSDTYVIYNAADDLSDEYREADFKGSLMLPFQASLGANFTTGDIGIAARIDTAFAGNYKADEGDYKISFPFQLNFHLWPSYNVGFATIGLDFGLLVRGTTTAEMGSASQDLDEGGIKVGFGLWLKKGFGNSSVKLGVAYKVGTEFGGVSTNGQSKDKERGVLSIPIVFDYSF